jgi:hypothetical protein
MLRSLPAAVLVCAAFVAGCGAGGGEGSKERFIAAADKVCDRLGTQFDELATAGTAGSARVLLRRASKYRRLTRELSAGLAASTRPAGDEDAARIVSLSRRLASAARVQKVRAQQLKADYDRGASDAVNGDVRTYNLGARRMKRTIADPLDKLLLSYGFENCGHRTL